MGNTMTLSCCGQSTYSRTALMVKLIFYGGETRILTVTDGRKRNIAGEIMFEFPDHMVCHADSFFIGHPIPALAIDDELMAGETYFVLPLDCFSSSSSSSSCTHHVLSVSSLASLGSSSSSSSSSSGKRAVPVINFRECPLQYVKSSSDGRVLIKVMPEFMIKLMDNRNRNRNFLGQNEDENTSSSGHHGLICSTPELKKHYDQLVGCSKVHAWSPKLETISEYKIRYSPCRFLGFERKLGE